MQIASGQITNVSQKNGGDSNALPQMMKVDIKIGYGFGFTQRVKTNQVAQIKNVMKHAQAHYCKTSSLGAKIQLSYGDNDILNFKDYSFYSDSNTEPIQLIPTVRGNNLKHLTAQHLGNADLMVFFDYDTNVPQKDTTAGVAPVGTVCNRDALNSKWSMNEWSDKAAQTGLIVAHEVGHNLGLNHNANGACTGPMDSAVGWWIQTPGKGWSQCSKNAFLQYYQTNKNEEVNNCWCMDSNIQNIDCPTP